MRQQPADAEHQLATPAFDGVGGWRRWLDSHINRELGVGAPPGTPPERPNRVVFDTLLDTLGQPQHQYCNVIVGGTNGKTTTTRATSALLQARGVRVGTYTSPHLDRLNERIAIDTAPIPDRALADVLRRIAGLERELPGPLSWFEIMTAAAMLWFAQQHVDLAVIEVGLGGQYDATAAAPPTLVALTNIDLDHAEYFGTTRPEVAAAEAGIIAAGHGLVLGETDLSLRDHFTQRHPHPIWIRDIDFAVRARAPTTRGQILTLDTPAATYDDIPVTLHGPQHADNIALALTLAECVAGPAPDTTVRTVLAALRAPGRIELGGTAPHVILDGAHNPAGARALATTLDESFPADRRTFILGSSTDKPITDIVAALRIRPQDRIVCCSAQHPRARPANELLASLRRSVRCTITATTHSVADILVHAIETTPRGELIVVTGSLYVVAEARRQIHRANFSARKGLIPDPATRAPKQAFAPLGVSETRRR